jgi:serine/threonine protein kinase
MARYATFGETGYSPKISTLLYRAPEAILGRRDYNSSVDIWAVGVIIAKLASGVSLFAGDSEIDMIYKICNIFGSPRDWPEVQDGSIPRFSGLGIEGELSGIRDTTLVDLIAKLVVINPTARLTAEEALKHPFFAPLTQFKNL